MSEVFLDTSISIARIVHSRETKERIRLRLSEYDVTAISLTVRQEFKRRLLKEAQYLLRLLNDKKSFEKVQRHVNDVLGPRQSRKKQICLQMLFTIFESADDAELTERAIRMLRTLLRTGLADLSSSVNYEVTSSECRCAKYPVVEKVPYKRYDFGPDKCSKAGPGCGISTFLHSKHEHLLRIQNYLRELPEPNKSQEIREIEKFIEKILADTEVARSLDPCLTAGDLVIALESIGVPAFYTMNRKESVHLSRLLSQDLIIRPQNPLHEDEVLLESDPVWPASR